MSKEKSSSSLGVLIILAGVAILLFNLNILKLSMFWGVVKLWPLLLVIAGLGILFKNVRYFSVVLWLGFIGVVIGYSYLNMDDKTWFFGDKVDLITYEEPAENIDFASMDFDVNIGSIKIKSHDLAQVVYSVPETDMQDASFNSGEDSELKIADMDSDVNFGIFQSREYKVTIPEEGSWAIEIDGGIIGVDMDLEAVPLNNVDIDFGIGDIELHVNEASEGLFKLNLGIGDVKLYIPKSIGVKVFSDSGLTSVDVPNYFSKSDDVYTSDNYETADHQIDIKLDIGIGSFEIK